MILGSISVDDQAIQTHRDSYLLESLTVVSVRRPFMPIGVLLALGIGGFGVAFHDLLWAHELLVIAIVCAAALFVGSTIGQLQLLSRDLRGSELSGAIFGSYGHLNRLRTRIVAARRSVLREVQS